MGGRLLKKAIGNHLSEMAIDDAAEGYTTRKGAKHLGRCIHCRGQVRCIKNQREAERIIEEDGRRHCERMRRQSQVSYNLSKEPALPIPDPASFPGPRLLSGAERDSVFRKLSGPPAMAMALLVSLLFTVVGEEREHANVRQGLIIGILVMSGMLAVMAFLAASASGLFETDDDDQEDDHNPEDDEI